MLTQLTIYIYHLVLLNIIAIAAMTNTADYIGYLHTSSIIH